MAVSRSNCLCKYVRETKFAGRGYFWYRWMAFAQEHLFGENMTSRSNVVTWPQDAAFGVSAYVIREQPRWMYEAMLRLTTVEQACLGGTIMWAHSIER